VNEITSRDNPHIKQAVALRKSAAERRAQGLFFLDGYRLCVDALASGFVPQVLFCTALARRKYDTVALETVAAKGLVISEAVALKLGDTETPQGVFAVCAQKRPPDVPPVFAPQGRYIALENVQNPGNLGAVARTAEALGMDALLCGGGCDIYHPKALRASMGAVLRLPVFAIPAEGFAAALREAAQMLRCFASVPDANAIPVTRICFGRGSLVAVGSEGNGLTAEAIAVCHERITIPMPGKAESLNAAAAATILMWMLAQPNEE
jgi:TrmH family RNA methyltransferase